MGAHNKKNRAWARKEQAHRVNDRILTKLMIKQLKENEKHPENLLYPEKLGLVRHQESRDKMRIADYLAKGGVA